MKIRKNKESSTLFIDGDGCIWNQDGDFVLCENADPLMDFVNRICNGESIEEADAASNLLYKKMQEKIAEAKRMEMRVPL